MKDLPKNSTCTDCGSGLDIELCTVCQQPVCPQHRSGTGRLKDGYQCSVRECWHVGYPGKVGRALPSVALPDPLEPMKWFTGRFDVERSTVLVACRHCDAVDVAIIDTYSSPVWPAPALWCQPPEGWALLFMELPTAPQDVGDRIFARCSACRPQPPAYCEVDKGDTP